MVERPSAAIPRQFRAFIKHTASRLEQRDRRNLPCWYLHTSREHGDQRENWRTGELGNVAEVAMITSKLEPSVRNDVRNEGHPWIQCSWAWRASLIVSSRVSCRVMSCDITTHTQRACWGHTLERLSGYVIIHGFCPHWVALGLQSIGAYMDRSEGMQR